MKKAKVIEGKINKITDKYCFLYIPGLKSEPVLDIMKLKSLGLKDKIKIGKKNFVLLKKLKIKWRSFSISQQSHKIKGWNKLVEAYEKMNQ